MLLFLTIVHIAVIAFASPPARPALATHLPVRRAERIFAVQHVRPAQTMEAGGRPVGGGSVQLGGAYSPQASVVELPPSMRGRLPRSVPPRSWMPRPVWVGPFDISDVDVATSGVQQASGRRAGVDELVIDAGVAVLHLPPGSRWSTRQLGSGVSAYRCGMAEVPLGPDERCRVSVDVFAGDKAGLLWERDLLPGLVATMAMVASGAGCAPDVSVIDGYWGPAVTGTTPTALGGREAFYVVAAPARDRRWLLRATAHVDARALSGGTFGSAARTVVDELVAAAVVRPRTGLSPGTPMSFD